MSRALFRHSANPQRWPGRPSLFRRLRLRLYAFLTECIILTINFGVIAATVSARDGLYGAARRLPLTGRLPMNAVRLRELANSVAIRMVTMVLFLACVGLWSVSHHPAMDLLLPHLLVGFPAVTLTGILVGLRGSLFVGNIVGATFALSFNRWDAFAGRSQPAAGAFTADAAASRSECRARCTHVQAGASQDRV